MQVPFSVYGLILGIAIVVGVFLIERHILKMQFATERALLTNYFYKAGILVFICAVFGARGWHIFTDFSLYKDDFVSAFYIWNGGLSIIGAVVGGMIGIILSGFVFGELRKQKTNRKKKLLLLLLDYSVFGLPVGQALGRWGNYFNQELYGLPTTSFLKIFIAEEKRLPGYEKVAFYQPLFLYEMIATGLFAVLVHVLYQKKFFEKKIPKIGSGKLFLAYIFYYSFVRFLLDFLRISRGKLYFGVFGFNQIFLMGILLLISVYFLVHNFRIIYKICCQKEVK